MEQAIPPQFPLIETQYFKALVEGSDDAIIGRTLDGTVTSWNKGALKLYGYSAKEIIGKSIDVLIPPDKRSELADIDKRLVQGRSVRTAETERLTKTGQRVCVSISFSPIKDSQGKVISVASIARDITEKKKAEELIRRNQAQLEAIFQAVTEGIAVFDPAGNLIMLNEAEAKLVGYHSREEMLKNLDYFAKTFRLRLPNAQEVPLDQWPVSKVLRGEAFHQYELWAKRLDTNQEWFISFSGAPVLDKHGKLSLAVVISRDITERKILEQRKDDFTAMVSHELKTPVTSMKIYSQVLKRRFESIGDQASVQFLNNTDKQLNKLTELIHGLLDISRAQQGKLPYKQERFRLDDLVQEMAENTQRISQAHTIQIKGRTTRLVQADRDRIGQILVNLLSNAIKFSPKGGDIIVRLHSKRTEVEIQVTDFGLGIPKHQQNQVFERFFQGDSPTIKTYPGLGLGLYISKEIVERHGGRIWVSSEEGHGSTFHFTLPYSAKNL